MVLNDFAAYIQFLTAFYISLGFEQLVDKIFFNDVYKKRVKLLFFNIRNDIKLKDVQEKELNCMLITKIDNSRIIIRRISFISFVFCLVLLLVAGLEASIPQNAYAGWILFRNSWLGYCWLYMVLFISLPFIGISIWTLYRRFWKLNVLRRISRQGAKKLYDNVNCYLTGKYADCDNTFSGFLLKGMNDRKLESSQVLEYAMDEYTDIIVKRLKEKM